MAPTAHHAKPTWLAAVALFPLTAIDNKTVVVRLKVGAEDKAFGSITNQDIAAGLKAQHRVEIDRHKIDLKEPIKTLGEHQVALKLHRDVSAHLNVIVTQDR